jgi:GNAT superfamily N-acetyltransferase
MSTQHDLTIRMATPADVPLLLGMVKELAEYERLLEHVSADEADYQLALFGPGAHAKAALAELVADGSPVGYMVWFFSFSTFKAKSKLYLEDLYVRPAYRGRGFGKALLADLARRALDAGVPRMHWQVLDWNTPSIEFYRALGAEVHGNWLDCTLDRPALDRLAASGKKFDEG